MFLLHFGLCILGLPFRSNFTIYDSRCFHLYHFAFAKSIQISNMDKIKKSYRVRMIESKKIFEFVGYFCNHFFSNKFQVL